MVRSKTLAIAGCALLLGAVLIKGGLDIWMAAQPGWDLPSPARPLRLTLSRRAIYIGAMMWKLRQALDIAMICGIAVAFWGGWKFAPRNPPGS